MSINAMKWAWEQECGSAAEKLVLMALADNADNDGFCWPGNANTAARCEMSVASVRRHILALERKGRIHKVKRRRRKDGTLSVWIYRLPISECADITSEQICPVDIDEQKSAHIQAEICAPVSAQEPSLEPSKNHQSLAHVSDITQEGEIVEAEIVNGWELSFAAFWKLYPRKVAKAKAQTIWRKLKPDERDAAVQAVPAHVEMWRAEGRAMKHIPHPTTWLNERRYEDPLETDYQPQGSLVQRSARFALEAEARRRHDGSRSDGSDRSSDGDDYRVDGRGRAELCPGSERSGRPGGVDDGGYWFGSDVG